MGVDGEWIMAHQVNLGEPSTALAKLVKMASLAIIECLEPLAPEARQGIPLLLCVAELERPDGLTGWTMSSSSTSRLLLA